MNEITKGIFQVLLAAAMTMCFVMFMGLIAKCYWLLFMIGWGVL